VSAKPGGQTSCYKCECAVKKWLHATSFAGFNIAGFGHVLALHLDRLGATVFAGCLDAKGSGAVKLKEKCSDRLHVVQLDVTSDEQVAECVQYVVSLTNGLGKLHVFSFIILVLYTLCMIFFIISCKNFI